MSEDSLTYQIIIKGHLNSDWGDWLDGVAISHAQTDQGQKMTHLTVKVLDQSALYGVLMRLHSLNLELLLVKRLWMGNLTETEDN